MQFQLLPLSQLSTSYPVSRTIDNNNFTINFLASLNNNIIPASNIRIQNQTHSAPHNHKHTSR